MLTNINYGMPSQSNVNPDSIKNASEFEIYAEPSITKRMQYAFVRNAIYHSASLQKQLELV